MLVSCLLSEAGGCKLGRADKFKFKFRMETGTVLSTFDA